VKKGSPTLSDKVGQLLSTLEVLPLDEGTDKEYAADVRMALEKTGTPIGANDYLIAAHALSLAFTLVTDNVGEFSRVPRLDVENWLIP
jgi:Predicted nucleic acid-binding protein, contains PIN domain